MSFGILWWIFFVSYWNNRTLRTQCQPITTASESILLFHLNLEPKFFQNCYRHGSTPFLKYTEQLGNFQSHITPLWSKIAHSGPRPAVTRIFRFLKLINYDQCKCQGGFPESSVGQESACTAGDPGSIPGLGRSTGEGIGYTLRYSWASPEAQLAKNLPATWKSWVQSLGWEDP